MNKLVNALKIVSGVLIFCVIFILVLGEVLDHLETKKSYYSTYDKAKRKRLFKRGWVPEYIPMSSKNIEMVNGLSASAACVIFSIPISHSDGLINILNEKGYKPLRESYQSLPQFGFIFNICPYNSKDIKRTGSIVYTKDTVTLSDTKNVIGRHNTFFALDKNTGTVYYWLVPKRSKQ
ncbi:MAG: hypothetical protein GWN11_07610 [Candidatus Dadabacteria bacterium]|nr:hypothetical protein [Candidatus Dadabacteria bacterium]